MIKLYSFGQAFNLADPSPFVVKVDLHLKVNDIKFESIPDVNNLQKSPKGKLPFIDDDGTIIADSNFIVEHLKQRYNADVDSWLNETQKATAYLISKSIEENLYWCLVHSRWLDKDTWPIIKKNFFDGMPFPLNKIVPILAQRKVKKNINGHGLGLHNEQEIMSIAQQSLKSLSILLGNKPYYFDERISSLDICVYSMIANLTQSSIDNEMSKMAREFDNLVTFTQRIKNEYYPELE